MIEAVLFDLDNTLIDWYEAQRLYCALLAERLPPMADAERAQAMASIIEWLGDGNGIGLADWFRRITERWPCQASARELLEERNAVFPAFTVLLPYAKEMLSALKGSYRLGMLTNGSTAVQRAKIAAAGLEDYFEHIIISGETPWSKPDPRIFRHILSAMDVRPECAVYVGDNVEKDVYGAQGAGMRVIRLRHAGHPYETVDGVPEIDSLADLQELISEMEAKSR